MNIIACKNSLRKVLSQKLIQGAPEALIPTEKIFQQWEQLSS